MGYTKVTTLPEDLYANINSTDLLLLTNPTDKTSYKITLDLVNQIIVNLVDNSPTNFTNKTITDVSNKVYGNAIQFIAEPVQNISFGTPVKIVSNSSDNIFVDIATGTDNVDGIAGVNLTVGSLGNIIYFGTLSNYDTSAWSEGDLLYFQNGAYTVTPDLSQKVQFIGYVADSSATIGQILLTNLSTTYFASNSRFYSSSGRLSASDAQSAIEELSVHSVVTTSKIQINNNEIILPTTSVDGVFGDTARVYDTYSSTYFTEYTCLIGSGGNAVTFDPSDNLNNKYAVVTYLSQT